MKKIFLSLLFIVILIISYLIYMEISFSPLKQNDFEKIFKGYVGSYNESCRKDFLGITSHGELFEIYLYNIKGAIIDKGFPKLNKWENEELSPESIVGKWENCPLDSQTMELYKFTLTSKNFDDVKCGNSFNNELLNPKNYYSYIYFNELEQYFLLYCSNKQELYYIRRRGF